MTQIEQSVNQNKKFCEYGFTGLDKEIFDKFISNPNISIDAKILYLVFCRLSIGYDLKYIKKKTLKKKFRNYLKMSVQRFNKAYKELMENRAFGEFKLVCKKDIYLKSHLPLYKENTKFKYHIPDIYFDILLNILDKRTSLYVLSILMFDRCHSNLDIFGLTFNDINFNVGNLLNENNAEYMREKAAFLGLIGKQKYYPKELKGHHSYKYYITNWKELDLKELVKKAAIFPKNKTEYRKLKKLQEKEKNKIKAVSTGRQYNNHINIFRVFGERLAHCDVKKNGLNSSIAGQNKQKDDLLKTSEGEKLITNKSSTCPRQTDDYNFMMKYFEDSKKYLEDLFLDELKKLNKTEIFQNFNKQHIYNFRKNDKYCFDNNIESLRVRAIEIEPKLTRYKIHEIHNILIKVSGLSLKSISISGYKIESSLLLYLANPNNQHFRNALIDYLQVYPIQVENKQVSLDETLSLLNKQKYIDDQIEHEQIKNAPRSARDVHFNINNKKNTNRQTLAEIKGMENLKINGFKSIRNIFDGMNIRI